MMGSEHTHPVVEESLKGGGSGGWVAGFPQPPRKLGSGVEGVRVVWSEHPDAVREQALEGLQRRRSVASLTEAAGVVVARGEGVGVIRAEYP